MSASVGEDTRLLARDKQPLEQTHPAGLLAQVSVAAFWVATLETGNHALLWWILQGTRQSWQP